MQMLNHSVIFPSESTCGTMLAFYSINDLALRGFDTLFPLPSSNLLGELRWEVMVEKTLEPSVPAGQEESDCFLFLD